MSSIPEYYLHLFCGTNGDNDQYTGAGRIAIAALMAGYGLTATTKKDLQTRIGWETTPGCFLGQKELANDAWAIRNRPYMQMLNRLLSLKKASRVLNYTLNWQELESLQANVNINSEVWPILARIYWMGRFMFGRNVFPGSVMDSLRTRFNGSVDPRSENSNIFNAYVMQFFYDNRFFQGELPAYVEGSYLPVNELEATSTRLPREKIFMSLAFAMNPVENALGFYCGSSFLPSLMTRGQSFGNSSEVYEFIEKGRSQLERAHSMPLSSAYYGSYNLGSPSVHTLDGSDSRFPTHPRDIIPLLFCKTDMTPEEERDNNFRAVYSQFNPELVRKNVFAYCVAAILYESHILLTGRELFPISVLQEARAQRGWDEEQIISTPPQMYGLNNRNCTFGRMVKFNLDRQNRV